LKTPRIDKLLTTEDKEKTHTRQIFQLIRLFLILIFHCVDILIPWTHFSYVHNLETQKFLNYETYLLHWSMIYLETSSYANS